MEITTNTETNAVTATAVRENPLSGRNKLAREDFYKIMIAEMTNQDPFEPNDNQKFLEQVASLQSLESTQALSDSIDKLILRQEMSSATDLIGKHVVAIGSEGEDIRGFVEKLRVRGNEVGIVLASGAEVKLDQVIQISKDGGAEGSAS